MSDLKNNLELLPNEKLQRVAAALCVSGEVRHKDLVAEILSELHICTDEAFHKSVELLETFLFPNDETYPLARVFEDAGIARRAIWWPG